MLIEDFIQKAIQGGWNGLHSTITDRWEGHKSASYDETINKFPDLVFFDPKAWEAVGYIEKWDKEPFIQGEMPNWKYKMYRMVDSLMCGNTLIEFIGTLSKSAND